MNANKLQAKRAQICTTHNTTKQKRRALLGREKETQKNVPICKTAVAKSTSIIYHFIVQRFLSVLWSRVHYSRFRAHTSQKLPKRGSRLLSVTIRTTDLLFSSDKKSRIATAYTTWSTNTPNSGVNLFICSFVRLIASSMWQCL